MPLSYLLLLMAMAKSSLLVSYPSSSEESDENNDTNDVLRKRKVDSNSAVQSTDDEQTQKKRSKVTLPLPDSIRQMGSDKLSGIKDDPSEHSGRIRSFPHEEGNWATLVYIPYEPEEEFYYLQKELFLCLRPLEFQPMEDYHVSLSRTVTIRHHWIQTLVDSIRKGLSKIESCGMEIEAVKVYTNDEKTRSFLALNVTSGSDVLQQYVAVVDDSFKEYKLQQYYQPPSFHISIGWCLGDITSQVDQNAKTKLKNKTGSIMGNFYSVDHIAEDHIHTDFPCNIEEPQQKYRLGTETLERCLKEEPELQFFFVDTVRCKTGNKEFHFPLADT